MKPYTEAQIELKMSKSYQNGFLIFYHDKKVITIHISENTL